MNQQLIIVIGFAVLLATTGLLDRHLKPLGPRPAARAIIWILPVVDLVLLEAVALRGLADLVPVVGIALSIAITLFPARFMAIAGGPTSEAALASEIRIIEDQMSSLASSNASTELETQIRARLEKLDRYRSAEDDEFIDSYQQLLRHFLDGLPMSDVADSVNQMRTLRAQLNERLRRRGAAELLE